MLRLIHATFLVLVFSSGCSWFTEYVYVHDRFPEISKPKIGQMGEVSVDDLSPLGDNLRNMVVGNIVVLRTHIQQLEAAVDAYNDVAKHHNESLIVGESK